MALLVAGTLGFLARKQHQEKGSISKEALLIDAGELVQQLADAGREAAMQLLQEAPGAVRGSGRGVGEFGPAPEGAAEAGWRASGMRCDRP